MLATAPGCGALTLLSLYPTTVIRHFVAFPVSAASAAAAADMLAEKWLTTTESAARFDAGESVLVADATVALLSAAGAAAFVPEKM